jgi:hypothetical protein
LNLPEEERNEPGGDEACINLSPLDRLVNLT